MHGSILVPLDGSDRADRALPVAANLADDLNARLILLRCIPAVPARALDEREAEALTELAACAAGRLPRPDQIDLRVRPVADGDVAGGIIAEAREQKALMIVLAAGRGRGVGRLIFGSVADGVVRAAERPVCLVNEGCREAADPFQTRRIVVPLDGSRFAEEAIAPARRLASAVGGQLLLVRVVAPAVRGGTGAAGQPDPAGDLVRAQQYLASVAHNPQLFGVRVTTHVLAGEVEPAIAAFAREHGAALIAMATHGHTGLARLTAGSVAMATLERAETPLLLIRPLACRERTPDVAMAPGVASKAVGAA